MEPAGNAPRPTRAAVVRKATGSSRSASSNSRQPGCLASASQLARRVSLRSVDSARGNSGKPQLAASAARKDSGSRSDGDDGKPTGTPALLTQGPCNCARSVVLPYPAGAWTTVVGTASTRATQSPRHAAKPARRQHWRPGAREAHGRADASGGRLRQSNGPMARFSEETPLATYLKTGAGKR